MSQNFASFASIPFVGTPYGQPVQVGKPITTGGPSTVALQINWVDYGASTQNQQVGVSFNLLGQATTIPLDNVRSVYIDNTFVSVPVYVQFPDTLFTVLCPAYSVVCCPVFTNVQQGVIYADGFQTGEVPTTRIFFSNVTLSGFYIPATTGGNSGAPTTPVILYYGGIQFNSSSGGWNWANVAIGDPDTDRVVAIVFEHGAGNPGVNQANITSVTIGGIAATRRIIRNLGGQYSQLWDAPVPTGTTTTVTVTTSGASNAIPTLGFIYAMRNLQNPVPIAVNSAVKSGGGSSAAIQINTNGIILAGGTQINSASFAWQNVQQNGASFLFTAPTGQNYYGSAASALTNNNGSVTISSTADCFVVASYF